MRASRLRANSSAMRWVTSFMTPRPNWAILPVILMSEARVTRAASPPERQTLTVTLAAVHQGRLGMPLIDGDDALRVHRERPELHRASAAVLVVGELLQDLRARDALDDLLGTQQVVPHLLDRRLDYEFIVNLHGSASSGRDVQR